MVGIAIKPAALRKSLIIGVLGCMLAAPGLAAAQALARIVVFGDSLSDPGNAFALAGGTNTPPDYSQDFFLVPDRPYARGGHHFSNGATWAEHFARSKGLGASALPAFRGSNGSATNYAVGGARAYDHPDTVNLTQQVGQFLQDVGSVAPGDALYFVAVGGNDLRDVAATGNTAIVGLALESIKANILQLYAAGARRFVVWNAPKIAVTPAIRALDAILPGAAAQVDGLTLQYNMHLGALLSALQGFPGITILQFDAYGKVAAIHEDGAAFGLGEVNAPCITPNVPPFACQNPDDYMFWDGIHPTRAVHAIIAQEIAALLGP